MEELLYPLDTGYILKNKKKIKRMLASRQDDFLKKRIAIMGGSTTNQVKDLLNLFLLNNEISCDFYETEQEMFWEEAVFKNEKLESFSPDVIYFYTNFYNIAELPTVHMSDSDVDELLEKTFLHMKQAWEEAKKYHCVVIQNNFEYPNVRLLGSQDGVDYRGYVNYINRLNNKIAGFARENEWFYVLDINYISSVCGLEKWYDLRLWYEYRYSMSMTAMVQLAYNLANLVRTVYSGRCKVAMLDLDNTLWGGIVSEDTAEQVLIGGETATGQLFLDVQRRFKQLKDAGVVLCANSKNTIDDVIEVLDRRDCFLKQSDFTIIKANWEPKDTNSNAISEELNISLDDVVFVDDSNFERELVKNICPGVKVLNFSTPDQMLVNLDRCGYFDILGITAEDRAKTMSYQTDQKRKAQAAKFEDYDMYLHSLKMEAELGPFNQNALSRIVQLINKVNRFNLTTRRLNTCEAEECILRDYTLCGSLRDRFGDYGIITAVIGRIDKDLLTITDWTMSCRVFGRGVENMVMNHIVRFCEEHEILKIQGMFVPSQKNQYVNDFYRKYGFDYVKQAENGCEIWEMLVKKYKQATHQIKEIEE